jgi:hypothetical protein
MNNTFVSNVIYNWNISDQTWVEFQYVGDVRNSFSLEGNKAEKAEK